MQIPKFWTNPSTQI